MASNDEIRQLLEQRKQHRDAQGKFAKKTVFEVAKELGVDTSDLLIRDLASRESDLEDVEKAVLRTAVHIHYSRPTEADRPSSVSKPLPPVPEQVRLQAEFEQGAKSLFGRDLLNFKMAMRKKGWKGS